MIQGGQGRDPVEILFAAVTVACCILAAIAIALIAGVL